MRTRAGTDPARPWQNKRCGSLLDTTIVPVQTARSGVRDVLTEGCRSLSGTASRICQRSQCKLSSACLWSRTPSAPPHPVCACVGASKQHHNSKVRQRVLCTKPLKRSRCGKVTSECAGRRLQHCTYRAARGPHLDGDCNLGAHCRTGPFPWRMSRKADRGGRLSKCKSGFRCQPATRSGDNRSAFSPLAAL